MSYIDDSTQSTLQWEGSIPWMYLDTDGNVTVGCGEELSNPAAACNLPFQLNGADASVDDIVAGFQRVKALPAGKEAGFYQSDSSPTLTQETITALLQMTISGDDGTLRSVFSGWALFPDPAKQALLDMEFNLGEGELVRGYPLMDAAIRAQNWTSAAEQCHRRGISDARNEWTKNLFLQAAGAS